MASNIEIDPDQEETDRLRGILIHRGIHHNEPHEKVAQKANLSPSTVANFIHWKTKRPQVETLKKLGRYVGLRLTWVEINAPRQPNEPKYGKKERTEVDRHRAQNKED